MSRTVIQGAIGIVVLIALGAVLLNYLGGTIAPLVMAGMLVLLYLFTYLVGGYEFDASPELFGRILPPRKSGFHLDLPGGLMKHNLVSTQDFRMKDEIVYISSNDVQVRIPVNMFVAADPDVRIPHGDLAGTSRFAQIRNVEEDLKPGLRDRVAVTAVAVGTRHTDKDAKENLPALTVIVNCQARLTEMPHEHHDPANCGVPDCGFEAGRIEQNDLLQFYAAHQTAIQRRLSSARAHREQSDPEREFGVSVSLITLNEPQFSGGIIEAGEAKRKTQARKDAANPVLDLGEEIKKRFPGISDAGVFDRALHLAHGTQFTSQAFEGLEGGAAINAAAAKLASGSTNPKGDKR